MPEIKASTITYSFTLSEMKKILAKELNVPEEVISVTYDQVDVSDSDDRYPIYEVRSVSVKIDNTKIKK